MENSPAAFDLSQAIEQWRDQLRQSPAFRRENLDELESHLRDSAANLIQRGLAPEEAYLIAVRRIGSAAALGTEFGKLNAQGIWLNRLLWMLVGVQLFGWVGAVVHALTTGVTVLGLYPLWSAAHSHPALPLCAGVLYGVLHLLLWLAALAAGWKLLNRSSHGWSARLQTRLNHARGFTLTAVACVVVILFPSSLGIGSNFLSTRLLFNYANPADTGRFLVGSQFGSLLVGLVESALLVTLTLWLARRQGLTKTAVE
jgi:hypothetical protein